MTIGSLRGFQACMMNALALVKHEQSVQKMLDTTGNKLIILNKRKQ